MALPPLNSPKMSLHTPAFALALLGFLLLAIALITPAWQVVYARELRQWVQSGLFMACQTRPNGMYSCTYAFTENDFDFYTSAEIISYRTPAFYQWQRTLLHILLIVEVLCLVALFSFCISSNPSVEKCAAATFAFCMAIATVVCLGCMLAFSVLAHMVEYRFYHVSVSGIYEKHVGYSFYLGIVAGICFLLSLGFALAYLAKTLRSGSSSNRSSMIRQYQADPYNDGASSSHYTFNSRDDYRMATSDELRFPHDHDFAMRALPALPRKQGWTIVISEDAFGSLRCIRSLLSTKILGGTTQAAAIGAVAVANLFTFIAVITPAWQVAEDLDVNRYVQSGLWLYCPGASQCWYIFSDDLINYYERVDVCRFLLIGDCRKKLLRTPYFFGWHYAVLILCILTLVSGTLAIAAVVIGWLKPNRSRVMTVLYDIFVFVAWLLLAVGLAVFMINAEMLESKYLIGVKNTFEKSYGYSVYLAGLGLLLYTFAMMAGLLLSTLVFLTGDGRGVEEAYAEEQQAEQERAQRLQAMQHFYAPSKTGTLPHGDFDGLPTRSVSPSSQQLMAAIPQGQLSPGDLGDRGGGTFTPTTRHFYSY